MATKMSADTRYAVAGYKGIAFWFKDHPEIQPECEGHPASEFSPMGETFYCDGSCESPYADEDNAIMVMVGDDREHVVEIDDCTPIDDDDYCSECGQIGCQHDGRS